MADKRLKYGDYPTLNQDTIGAESTKGPDEVVPIAHTDEEGYQALQSQREVKHSGWIDAQ